MAAVGGVELNGPKARLGGVIGLNATHRYLLKKSGIGCRTALSPAAAR
jgi:hypothetical protein